MISSTYAFFVQNNISPTSQGLLTTCHAFAQLICSPIIGKLVDLYGRKLIFSVSFSCMLLMKTKKKFRKFFLLVSIDLISLHYINFYSHLGTLIGYLFLGFSSNFFFFALGRILIGITRHSVLLVKAYFSKLLQNDAKTQAFTYIASISSFAFLLG